VTGSAFPQPGSQQPGRLDNGLLAPTYVPLTDVDVEVGRALLTALGRARIAAYIAPRPGEDESATRQRLFVNADERADARTIVASAVRGLNAAAETPEEAPTLDPLAGLDTDAAFAELVADWHVDTVAAIRQAERDLNREDADWRARLEHQQLEDPVWLDDEHYIPPPPPPLPRLSAPTVLAVLVMLLAIAMLAVGGLLGLGYQLTMLLGIGGLLVGAGMLVMRLRVNRDEDDEDDDGAVI
jgi:hypothetical protein